MNDFDYECKQRKQLARNARYRKCGSKSKKCSMSTDHMTDKQWRERNGEVVTMNLNTPVTWAEFKSYSGSLQKEYVEHLVSEYGVNMTKLAEMFGCSTATMKKQFSSVGIDINFKAGNSMSKEALGMWSLFLSGHFSPPERTCENNHTECDERGCNGTMAVTHFTISFSGKISVNDIANTLRSMFVDGATGSVQISCDLTQSKS